MDQLTGLAYGGLGALLPPSSIRNVRSGVGRPPAAEAPAVFRAYMLRSALCRSVVNSSPSAG